jgi:drug/metabolite transporter (DMT)-like permease
MQRAAYILLTLTTLFWGGNAIAGKVAVGHISPMLLTGLRWTFAFALLLPFAWPQLKRDWTNARSSMLTLFLLGAVGFTAYNLAFYSALLYTTAVNVSIEHAAIPMVIFIANFLLFGTRVTWLQVAGFILSVVGVIVVASHGDPHRLLSLDLNQGDALMLLAILFYGGYTVMLRFKPDIHWQTMMLALTGSAAIASVPFVIVEFATGAGIWPDAAGWAVGAYTVIFPSLLAQAFYMRGVELIGPNRAGLFINLVPIFGTLLAIALLGEAFEAYHAVAIVLVMGGIGIAEWSGRRARG